MENIKQYVFLIENEVDKIGEKEGYVRLTALRLAIEDLRQAVSEYEGLSQGRGL